MTLTATKLEMFLEIETRLRAEFEQQLAARSADLERCQQEAATQRQLLQATIDRQLATIAELSAKLRALPQLQSCLTTKAFLYVSGREAAAADSCAVAKASEAFASNGNGFPALLKGLVEAPAFRLRRAAPATP